MRRVLDMESRNEINTHTHANRERQSKYNNDHKFWSLARWCFVQFSSFK
jgi:hypothetical protein